MLEDILIGAYLTILGLLAIFGFHRSQLTYLFFKTRHNTPKPAGHFAEKDLPRVLVQLPLFNERYGVAFAKGHRFERLNAVPIKELDAEPYVQRTACEFNSHWKAMGMANRAGWV